MSLQRVRYLDGLRGVLAIIVFLHHFFYAFCPDLIFGGKYDYYLHTGPLSFYKIMALTPINIFFNPGFAIHFFFLLSGYVQTRNYFLQPNISFLQKSLLKRYFRLAVPVLSAVLLVFFSHRFFLIRKDLIPFNELTSDWVKSLVPNNLHFFEVIKEGLSDCFRGNSRYYQVLWTMSTELINSFVVLGLLLVLHNLKHQVKIIVFLILVQLVVLQEYYSVAFVAGTLFAKLEVNSGGFKKILSNRLVHFLCLILGIYFASYPFTGYQNAAAHSFYAPISFFEVYPHVISYLIGVVFLFCFLLYSNMFQKFLSKKLFMFFGEISFMFYLIHLLLLLSFTPWVYHKFSNPNDDGLGLFITGIVSLVVVTLASYILTRLIDAPTIKLSNRLVKRFF
ncbi:acyltransferase family protein [Aurantibacillus circumpalustris]|uniref:acyltransferase family protein n=1 Tax=Aurantibacillus circumpalustris TaxID=3036359 RepID=UPI00295BE008|nr:acyltransferase [Aurantibacillus circumpalustris]